MAVLPRRQNGRFGYADRPRGEVGGGSVRSLTPVAAAGPAGVPGLAITAWDLGTLTTHHWNSVLGCLGGKIAIGGYLADHTTSQDLVPNRGENGGVFSGGAPNFIGSSTSR
jgi:hypothetical protein